MGVGPAPHYRDRSTELYPSPNKSMQGASQPDRGGAPAPLGMVIGARGPRPPKGDARLGAIGLVQAMGRTSLI